MRRLARIRYRLLAFNVLLVFLPASGILFLDTYERQLLVDQERAMVEQGRILAASLGNQGELWSGIVEAPLVALRQGGEARLRVIAPDGRVLADTSSLGPKREAAAADPVRVPGATPSTRESWLYRLGALPFRAYRHFFARPPVPIESAEPFTRGEPWDGPELHAALAGRYGAAARVSTGGQRSLTLYSALPVASDGQVVGVVLVSQSTYRILQKLYEVRSDVLRVLLASAAVAIVLSLFVSRTIARPLLQLRDQAEAIVDRRAMGAARFGLPERRDEIGDLARSLDALRERLQAQIASAEHFASDVSHELKNPLASIRTATELVQEVEDPEERQKFVEMIQHDVARMERLLSDVLELSRLDADIRPDDEVPVDLGALLEALGDAYRLRTRHSPSLRVPEIPIHVLASPDRLEQIFENLIENACGLSQDVDVALTREGNWALVRVLDRGPGIAPQNLERVFDRFFSERRREEERAPRHSGLGLAIARAIARQAGGELAAANRPDKQGGAAFEIRLPSARRPPS